MGETGPRSPNKPNKMIMITLFTMMILLMMISGGIYRVEDEANRSYHIRHLSLKVFRLRLRLGLQTLMDMLMSIIIYHIMIKIKTCSKDNTKSSFLCIVEYKVMVSLLFCVRIENLIFVF